MPFGIRLQLICFPANLVQAYQSLRRLGVRRDVRDGYVGFYLGALVYFPLRYFRGEKGRGIMVLSEST